MTRPRFKNPWNSEAEIATAVRQALESTGWEVHPECNGFDLFAVSRAVDGLEEGFSLGCECKLDAGTAAGYASLLRQILPFPTELVTPYEAHRRGAVLDYWRPPFGVHYRLAASARFTDHSLLRSSGVILWQMAYIRHPRWNDPDQEKRWVRWDPLASLSRRSHAWYSWSAPLFRPEEVPAVPDVVVDVPAGVPSPQTSGAWKVDAVRLMLRMRDGEPITSRDFRAADVQIKKFRDNDWIRDSGRRDGRSYIWEPGPGTEQQPPPDKQWPEIAVALREREAS